MKVRVLLFLHALVFWVLPCSLAGAEDLEILVARGIEKIQAGECEEAGRILALALQSDPQDVEANFYAGVARARLGQYEEAEGYLRKALAGDPRSAETAFELCLVASRLSRCDQARRYLSLLKQVSGEQDQIETASEFVSACGVEEKKAKPYYLNVTAGGQYDTNVILEPENPVPGVGKKGDFRGLLFLGAGWTPLDRDRVAIDLDYDFYQSFHPELNDFNLTYNRVTPSLEFRLSDKVLPSAGYVFEHTFLQGDSYGMSHEGYAQVLIREGARWSTEGRYGYTNLTYWGTDIFPGNPDRTGYRNSLEFAQNFSADPLSLRLYGAGDFERSAKGWWGYDGFRFGLEGSYEILPALHAGAEVCYGERRYKEVFPGAGDKRFDRQIDGTVMLTYLISKRLGVTLVNSTTGNFSNLGLFEYTRNITGLLLTAGVL